MGEVREIWEESGGRNQARENERPGEGPGFESRRGLRILILSGVRISSGIPGKLMQFKILLQGRGKLLSKLSFLHFLLENSYTINLIKFLPYPFPPRLGKSVTRKAFFYTMKFLSLVVKFLYLYPIKLIENYWNFIISE